MTESVAQRDPVEELAEEFLARVRRGERPALSEYTAAHPELADEIRDLFPALVMMEEKLIVSSEGRERAMAARWKDTLDGLRLTVVHWWHIVWTAFVGLFKVNEAVVTRPDVDGITQADDMLLRLRYLTRR